MVGCADRTVSTRHKPVGQVGQAGPGVEVTMVVYK